MMAESSACAKLCGIAARVTGGAFVVFCVVICVMQPAKAVDAQSATIPFTSCRFTSYPLLPLDVRPFFCAGGPLVFVGGLPAGALDDDVDILVDHDRDTTIAKGIDVVVLRTDPLNLTCAHCTGHRDVIVLTAMDRQRVGVVRQ